MLSAGVSSISYNFSLILIFSKPCFFSPKISFLYSPFLPLTIGENKVILEGFGKFKILSTISETVCDLISLPVNGE